MIIYSDFGLLLLLRGRKSSKDWIESAGAWAMLHGILWSSCRISEFLQPIEPGSNSLRVPTGVKDNTLHTSQPCAFHSW